MNFGGESFVPKQLYFGNLESRDKATVINDSSSVTVFIYFIDTMVH